MGVTLKDVRDQFGNDLADLWHVIAAYCTAEMRPARIHVWTLLDTRDDATEDALARAEHRLMTSFGDVDFDFTTIHLRGRDPVHFIPEGAYPITIRDARVLRFFENALRAGQHAGA